MKDSAAQALATDLEEIVKEQKSKSKLAKVVERVQQEAQQNPEGFLKESEVPEGGE